MLEFGVAALSVFFIGIYAATVVFFVREIYEETKKWIK
jgi:hypothetical protein